ELMMLGAFAGLGLMTLAGFPFWIAFVATVLAMGVFGIALERVVIRPILGQPAFTLVMLTIGIGYVARGLVTMIPGIGTETHTLPVPYKDQVWHAGPLVLNVEQMVVIGATAVLCLLLFAVFRYSKVGIAMQAASQNQLAAYYMGIPVKLIFSLIWAISAGTAAAAGILLAPVTLIDINMGLAVALKAFAAAVLGGFGSIPGALVGGIVIGLIELYAGATLPDGFKDTAPYIVLLVMLAVRPQGLFGTMTRKKV
ncbi:MAG TPA: branched-chain amino acid ABC transporter permease, partial [Reyranella sp.]|nr:branched-chain amino acid ABC transporter permease [Reyranella sp.]